MTDQTETEIQFIRRIMAMLLTLAGLAERAAGYPYPVRAFVLLVLRRAETAAQDFVGVEDLWAGAVNGNSPNDALDLADSLRELAVFLRDDLAQENLFQGWWRNGAAAQESDENPVIRVVKAIVGRSAAGPAQAFQAIAPAPRLDSS